MQVSGKMIATWTWDEFKGATIELPEVDIKSVNFGDKVWVEKTIPSNEPIEKWLARHKVITHFPQEKKDEGIKVPEKLNGVHYQIQLYPVIEAINALIDAVTKLAEKVK